MRSERGSDGRSRNRLRSGRSVRSGVRSRSREGGGGGGGGAGARSPGRMPAFSAAAVGRRTLTCRDGGAGRAGGGGGVTLASTPFVGATTSGAFTGSSKTGVSTTGGATSTGAGGAGRSEEHTSELQS